MPCHIRTFKQNIVYCDSFGYVSGPAVEYNGHTCQGVPIPPPILGQHTTEVLTGLLGYDDMDVLKLENDGIVKCYFEDPFQ